MPDLTPETAARFRAAFALTDSGAIIWRDRSADDFAAQFNVTPDVAENIAQDWQRRKAGQAPAWVAISNGQHATTLDRRYVLLRDIAAALGADLALAQVHADQHRDALDARDAKNAILRLCRIDRKTGQIVWRKRTPDNAPKTPQERRNAFNATWAGKPLPVRDGTLKIQRKTVQEADARAWLQDAASKEVQDSEKS